MCQKDKKNLDNLKIDTKLIKKIGPNYQYTNQ